LSSKLQGIEHGEEKLEAKGNNSTKQLECSIKGIQSWKRARWNWRTLSFNKEMIESL